MISFNKNNVPKELLSEYIGVISILKYFFISTKCCSKEIVVFVELAFFIALAILEMVSLFMCLISKKPIKFLLLMLSDVRWNVFKKVWLKSIIVKLSSKTTYPSDILSTIFCSAIGVTPKNLNLRIDIAHNNIVIVNVIGVTYIDIFIILRAPKILVTRGQAIPITINKDCIENKLEFFIDAFNKKTIPQANNEYEYKLCIIAYGPNIVSDILVEYCL